MTANFVNLPLYIPYLLTTVRSNKLIWHDAKAQTTCANKKISFDDIESAFTDQNRLVGLAKTEEKVLYDKNQKEVIVKEDRYFVHGNGLFVVFVLRDGLAQIVTSYWLKDKKMWQKLINTPYAYRAIPEIVGKGFNLECWLPIATTENGAIAHAVVKI